MEGGSEVYLYVLMEFQSTPERWMALRVLVYVGLLWQQLLAEGRLTADGRLPPVFPLVLYNGEGRWRAPLTLAELVGLPEASGLWPWQPAMRYHLIDEGGFPTEALARGETLAALLFAFKTAASPAEALPVVERVAEWFHRHPGSGELKQAFTAFIAASLAPSESPDLVEAANLLAEDPGMLATRIEEWKRQLRLEGRQEGAARLLRHQLERRFGPLPVTVAARIEAAEPETLEAWSLRLLDARSLDEVLQ